MSHRSGHRAGLPSQRQLRVGELVRKVLSEVLTRGEVRDPDIETHVVTVPEVRMSPDLKHATVFVMPLGGLDGETVVKALDRNRKWLRGRVARELDIKFTPELRFVLDTRFDDDSRIDALLSSPGIRRDLVDDEPSGEGPEGGEDRG